MPSEQVDRETRLLVRWEEGQGLTEYALLAVLISVAALVILVLIGPQVAAWVSQVNSAITTAGT